MKLSLVFLIILFLTLGTVACSGSPAAQKEAEDSVDASSALSQAEDSVDASSTLSQVVLTVPTMVCFACEFGVAASAKSVPGVEAVEIYGWTVIVTYDPEQATPDAIVEAIEDSGDRVTKVTKL